MRNSGLVVAFLPMTFVAVVIYLQAIQPNYNPLDQFMSELALGHAGWLMVFAFLSLSVSAAVLGLQLRRLVGLLAVPALLSIAAVGFAGAGLVSLKMNVNLHITFVATAFVSISLCMYLLPRCSRLFRDGSNALVSWGLMAALAVSVALGTGVVPTGLGQRFAAAFLILWLIWAGVNLSSSRKAKEGAIPQARQF